MSSGVVGEVAYRRVTREERMTALDDQIASVAASS